MRRMIVSHSLVTRLSAAMAMAAAAAAHADPVVVSGPARSPPAPSAAPAPTT